MKLRRLVVIALLISLLQTGFVLWRTDGGGLFYSPVTLLHADGQWYKSIVERGYVSTVPPTPQRKEISNVAFFPGYPIFARIIHLAIGVSADSALLIAAQVSNFVFWIYILAFLSAWSASTISAGLVVGLIAAHPAAFYMVSGYSESTFMTGVLGFIYWCSRNWIYAGLHGALMSSTRIVGPICAVLPFILPPYKPNAQKLSVTGLALCGILAFFAFCQLKFGVWNLYFETQAVGWGIQPNSLGFWFFNRYSFAWPAWGEPYSVGLFLTSWTVIAFLALPIFEFVLAKKRIRTDLAGRVGLYFCGFVIFYVSVCGTIERGFVSMLRYQFCAHVLLTLAAVHLAIHWPIKRPIAKTALKIAVVLVCLRFVVSEKIFADQFIRDMWVALN